MKKAILLFACLVCMLLIFTVFACASADLLPDGQTADHWEFRVIKSVPDEYEPEKSPSFKLPASLTAIEDGAFEGTAITSVELPENVTTIGDYAFAGIKTLKKISIPAATTFIGTHAFKGSDQVILTGAPKSYARVWARNNNYSFDPIASLYACVPGTHTAALVNRAARLQSLISEETAESNPKAQPTGRIMGELNADKYDEITSFHIQGRAPPMG